MVDDLDIPPFLRRKPESGGRRRRRATEEQTPLPSAAVEKPPERVQLTEYVRLAETPYEEAGFAIEKGVIPRRHYCGDPESEQVVQLHLRMAERALRLELREAKDARPSRAEKLAGTAPLSDVIDRVKGAPDARVVKKALRAAGITVRRGRFPVEDLERAVTAVAEYKPGARRPKSADLFDASGVIECRLRKNPKKPGTGAHERWALLMSSNGLTVAGFLKAGGNPTTLKNAVAAGKAKVTAKGEPSVARDAGSRDRDDGYKRKKRRHK